MIVSVAMEGGAYHPALNNKVPDRTCRLHYELAWLGRFFGNQKTYKAHTSPVCFYIRGVHFRMSLGIIIGCAPSQEDK